MICNFQLQMPENKEKISFFSPESNSETLPCFGFQGSITTELGTQKANALFYFTCLFPSTLAVTVQL